MQVTVQAHKGIGLDITIGNLGGPRRFTLAAGQSLVDNLTGDQVGEVQAALESQERNERLAPSMFGGHVLVHDKDHDQAPVGSKKWLGLLRDGTLEPNAAEYRTAAERLGLFKGQDIRKVKEAEVRLAVRRAAGLEPTVPAAGADKEP